MVDANTIFKYLYLKQKASTVYFLVLDMKFLYF